MKATEAQGVLCDPEHNIVCAILSTYSGRMYLGR